MCPILTELSMNEIASSALSLSVKLCKCMGVIWKFSVTGDALSSTLVTWSQSTDVYIHTHTCRNTLRSKFKQQIPTPTLSRCSHGLPMWTRAKHLLSLHYVTCASEQRKGDRKVPGTVSTLCSQDCSPSHSESFGTVDWFWIWHCQPQMVTSVILETEVSWNCFYFTLLRPQPFPQEELGHGWSVLNLTLHQPQKVNSAI